LSESCFNADLHAEPVVSLLDTSLIHIITLSIGLFVFAEQRRKRSVHLWQFLKELLMCPSSYQNAIRWLDQHRGW